MRPQLHRQFFACRDAARRTPQDRRDGFATSQRYGQLRQVAQRGRFITCGAPRRRLGQWKADRPERAHTQVGEHGGRRRSTPRPRTKSPAHDAPSHDGVGSAHGLSEGVPQPYTDATAARRGRPRGLGWACEDGHSDGGEAILRTCARPTWAPVSSISPPSMASTTSIAPCRLRRRGSRRALKRRSKGRRGLSWTCAKPRRYVRAAPAELVAAGARGPDCEGRGLTYLRDRAQSSSPRRPAPPPPWRCEFGTSRGEAREKP